MVISSFANEKSRKGFFFVANFYVFGGGGGQLFALPQGQRLALILTAEIQN
jgi:hypothetical protein